MENLQEQKKKIDQEIAELYRKRSELNHAISNDNSGKDSEDLRQLIANALKNTDKNFPEYGSVACQGVEGAYSQIAAERLFKYPGIMYFTNFEGVFSSIESGLCEYGILPIENSTAGSVNKIYDLMRSHKFYIARSIRIKIDHNLLVKPGTQLKNIKEIFSHEQAISQCQEFLKDIDAKVTACSNTAAAARMVAESDRDDVAALSSSSCAGLYNLEVLETAVQDRGNNYTRFICISKEPEVYPGANRTSVMAALPHKPGSLFNILKVFSEAGYNLVKLESRPIPGRDFEFMFYFDFEVSIYTDAFAETMCKLQEACDTFEYLGSYTEMV